MVLFIFVGIWAFLFIIDVFGRGLHFYNSAHIKALAELINDVIFMLIMSLKLK